MVIDRAATTRIRASITQGAGMMINILKSKLQVLWKKLMGYTVPNKRIAAEQYSRLGKQI